MNFSSLFLGVIPLLIFVILDTTLGPKKALLATIFVSILELLFSYYQFHSIDEVSIFSILLVIILALTSIKFKNSIYLKFHPVIQSSLFSLFLVISYFIKKPFLLLLMIKYKSLLPIQIQEQFSNPLFTELYKEGTLYLGIACGIHASWTYYAATKKNNWYWILVKSLGFYFLLFLSFFITVGKIQLFS